MGQKVNPNGFRYGITKDRNVSWYASKHDFPALLWADQKIRNYFEKRVRTMQIGKLEIKRKQNQAIAVIIHSAAPGKILGQGGENIKKMELDLKKILKDRKASITIQVEQIAKPELNARLVAEDIAIRLENRGSFRAAQKFAIRNAFKAGAKGIKTSVAGRLNGVDMARTEGYNEGEMRLHTLRQNVDYAFAKATTTYGIMGVKVWISRGEIVGGTKHVTTKKNEVSQTS